MCAAALWFVARDRTSRPSTPPLRLCERPVCDGPLEQFIKVLLGKGGPHGTSTGWYHTAVTAFADAMNRRCQPLISCCEGLHVSTANSPVWP